MKLKSKLSSCSNAARGTDRYPGLDGPRHPHAYGRIRQAQQAPDLSGFADRTILGPHDLRGHAQAYKLTFGMATRSNRPVGGKARAPWLI